MIPFLHNKIWYFVLSCYTNAIYPEYYIYPHERSMILIISIMFNIRYTLQGQM